MTDDIRHPVDLLAEEFAAKFRAGKSPTIEEYVDRYPEHADEIRAVFRSIEMVERVSQREVQLQQAASSGPHFSPRSAPKSLGDFEIVGEIGRGGMGVVYEAIQKSLKRHVALKVVSAIAAGSEKQQARFRREAEAAAGLHHTNIVPVYGLGEDQGLLYYTMQLIDGVTLSDIIVHLKNQRPAAVIGVSATQASQSSPTSSSESIEATPSPSKIQFNTTLAAGRLLGRANNYPRQVSLLKTEPTWGGLTQDDRRQAVTEPISIQLAAEEPFPRPRDSHSKPIISLGGDYFRNVAQIVANVANALQYAHHQKVFHRDIKPGNLLLDRDGTVWITDFGLARHADLIGVTQTGEIVGTLRYMAPEQLKGTWDARSDLYALGLTLYELLTLEPAWKSPDDLLTGNRPGSIPRLRAIRPEIPADLETIAMKACEAEPTRRYQSGAEFEEDLIRFLDDRTILARRVSSVERLWRWAKRNREVASLSAAILTLLIVLAGLLSYGYRQQQLALLTIGSEYARAENNLREKTAALERVLIEQARAETNLELAIQAFNQVADNIAARGASDFLFGDFDDGTNGDLTAGSDTTVSGADVAILETLLRFFERFSAENSKDLSMESADARRRVGDIQQQLGQLANAERSYSQSLQAYQSIAQRKPEDTSIVYAQVNVLNELMLIAGKRGQMPSAVDRFQQARRMLEQSDSIRESNEGRFALAITLNRFSSLATSFRRNPQMPFRNAGLPVIGRGNLRNVLPAAAAESLIRQANQANLESLNLLKLLVEQDPKNNSYRTALAQAYREDVSIALGADDFPRADRSLELAIENLQLLLKEHPTSERFKFELAYTLSNSVPPRPSGPRPTGGIPTELQRLIRAERICDDLIEAHPTNPEYLFLRSATLFKKGARQNRQERYELAVTSLSDAAECQKDLAKRYPDIRVYSIALLQTHVLLAEVYKWMKQPAEAKEHYRLAIQSIESYRRTNRLGAFMQPRIDQLREQMNAIP